MAHSLHSLHTFALNSQCQNFVEITQLEQLKTQNFSAPFCLLGEGSNTVFLNDYMGTVIKIALKGIKITERENDTLISIAAGENWHQLVSYLLEKNIPGLENLALIPGTVGASPVQNIGAYGVEIAKFVELVEYFDITTNTMYSLNNEQCEFAYRDSIFKHTLKNKAVITQVHLALPKKWQPALSYGPLQQLSSITPQAVFDQVIKTRNSKLPNPYTLANAGSFFKNPIITNQQLAGLLKQFADLPHYEYGQSHHKVAAGWLIDQSGLKGHREAGIEVHQQQALVLVNHGNSEGSDLIKMIKHIQQVVYTRYNIMLEHEVRLMDARSECHINAEPK
ncbi:UDP-N-acetylmuramate dehydrogenase [Pseudoalteromonas sp. SR43-6]|uniref:UDP-N-acetylmuramate dehydrogenase n=1 Tax=unclassified Pseudoalteromonas TaxID=194690 RepID=UPI0015FD32FE|nr:MULTISPECIES: UDP-N-acetylmuramate dehydrogenase [unclassified Pseudoalteromonas]MBB1290757.1 UDP-N-acetylmuramate dehydrogenase [Pseudoalteromonas sp. SR41-5]MBB1376024.1 UDP-N-acetylmuramate dehydrogenase [Pseudoalteromonas sp. SR43-6]MBB1415053.1 UDP-N-acetylmuramate dehydrogenase [Pseudoalteromonas sp. SG43-8]